jgi:phosphatidylethanolamine-binding protein (PEBP) family uncharacterized protein
LAWDSSSEGTKSFVLICSDYDVPSKLDDVKKEGRLVPAALLRIEFFHWLLLDIPAHVSEIAAGSQSNSIVFGGKAGPVAPNGFQHGINDFTAVGRSRTRLDRLRPRKRRISLPPSASVQMGTV